MPEKVKIVKALDNDTFLVQAKGWDKPRSMRLESNTGKAWYDGFEKDQSGFKIHDAVKALEGKEVDVTFKKQSPSDYKKNYDREQGSIATATIPDLAEHLFKENQVYKRVPGGKWEAGKQEPLDSLYTPQGHKAVKSLLIKKEAASLDPNQRTAYVREIQDLKTKFNFKTDQQVVDFVNRRSKIPYESLKTFQKQTPLQPTVIQPTMATPATTPSKGTLKYKDASKNYQTISVDQADALIAEGKITGTKVDLLKQHIQELGAEKDITSYEYHTGAKGTSYLFPIFKGESRQRFQEALKNDTSGKLAVFGNEYATNAETIQKWKDQFGVTPSSAVTGSLKLDNKKETFSSPVETSVGTNSERNVQPVFKTVQERNDYYKNLEDQRINNNKILSKKTSFTLGLPSSKKLLSEGLFNYKSEGIDKNTDINDSWYIGSGSDREFSGLEKIIVGGTAVGSMLGVAKKIPFVSAIPIAANAIVNLKKEAEMGDLEWQDAARESQKIAAELLLLSTLQKVGGSKPVKWIKDKSGKLVPSTESLKSAGKSVLKYTGKGANKAWKMMEQALGEVTKQATKKTLSPSSGATFNKTFYDKVMEQGGTLKFQRGGGIPKFQQSEVIPYTPYQNITNPIYGVNNYLSTSKFPTISTVKTRQQSLVDAGYNLGTTGVNKNGVDGNWGPRSRVVQNYVDFSKPINPYAEPNPVVPEEKLIPIRSATAYKNVDSPDSYRAETWDNTVPKTRNTPRFGYQEANLALSILPMLLNTKVKADKLSYQPYNPEIRAIQGDPLYQQRLNTIAQNRFLQNKATSSDPTQELVRRLVVNKQAMQSDQEARNIDTQARISDTQRYYGERNAANQFNYTNKQNTDNQNIQMNNAAMMQNAAQKNQAIGQTLQNTMVYITNKQNDQNLVAQNYLVHKNQENQGALDRLTPKYTSMWNALDAKGLDRTSAEYKMEAAEINRLQNEEYNTVSQGNGVNNLYSPYAPQLRRSGWWRNQNGGTLVFKKGGTISDATKVLAINTKKSTDTDKLFIQTAQKYNQLSAKVSTDALNRGAKLVVATLNSLPKAVYRSLPFKKIF